MPLPKYQIQSWRNLSCFWFSQLTLAYIEYGIKVEKTEEKKKLLEYEY